jgi:hypothetical protein
MVTPAEPMEVASAISTSPINAASLPLASLPNPVEEVRHG